MISASRSTARPLSLTFAAVVIVIQVLTLLLPRTPILMGVIYGMPVVTTFLLLCSRLFAVRIPMVAALVSVLAISFAQVILADALVLNVAFSIATYSSIALLLLAWGGSSEYLREQLVDTFWKSLTAVAFVIVIMGISQLVANGFPILLPYRDFSPDEFVGPYGQGGHRLIPMVLAPLIFWVGSLGIMHRKFGAKQFFLMLTLVFGAVAPGSNATILIIVATVLAYFTAVIIWRSVRSGFRRVSFRMMALGVGAVGILVVSMGALFVSIGQEGLAHSAASLRSLNPGEIREGSNPKVRAMVETLVALPRSAPHQPLIGIGLGNYSSWSQLLLSGVYADRFLQGRGLPEWFPVSYRDEAWQYVLRHISPEMYQRFGRFYAESVATLPWSSWQSLYAEIGLIGLLLIGVAFVPVLIRLQISPGDSPPVRALKMTIGLGLWFAVLCAFVDDYFEYPYLMVPVLLPLAFLGVNRSKAQVEGAHAKTTR